MKPLLLLDLTGRVFLMKEKVFYWLVSAFFISLFLPDMPVINNILIGATVMQSFFFNSPSEKVQLLKERKEIWMMILFYMLLIISGFMSADRKEALVMVTLRLPLLVFPICIGLLYIREELKDRILLSYCFFTTVACSVCMIYALQQFHLSGNTGDLYEDSLTKAVGRPSVYIAMAVNLALFTYVYLLQKKSFTIQYKGLVFLSIAFLILFHYMLASRVSIFTLWAGFLVFAVWHYGRMKRFWPLSLLIILMLAGTTAMIRYLPRTANRFRELKYANYNSRAGESHDSIRPDPDQLNGTNIRLSVWNCGWEVFREHPILGVPIGDKEQALMDVYRLRHFDYALNAHLNAHNTWLDVLINLGIPGLLVFLLAYLILPLINIIRMRDGLGLFIVLAFAMAISTETWPDRSVGCIMLAFFFSLVSAWKKKPA